MKGKTESPMLSTEQAQTLLTENPPSDHVFIFGIRPAKAKSIPQLLKLPTERAVLSFEVQSPTLEDEDGPEVSSIQGKPRPVPAERACVLRPDWYTMQFWGLVKDAFIIYSLVTSMFFLAFKRPDYGMWVMDVIVWAFFVVDIGVMFFLAYEDDEGNLVTSRKAIAWRYLTTWFLLDTLAIVPAQYSDYPDIEYYFRMVRMLKVTGALDLMDGQGIGMIIPFIMTHIIRKHNFVTLAQRHAATVIYILLYISFYTYTLGCIWFWFSEKTSDVHTNYISGVTKFADKMPGTDYWEKMERSWYFMITTLGTIGYGDFAATNVCEVMLLLLILLAGVTSYSYILGQFNFIVSELSSLEGDRVGDFVMWLKLLEAVQGKLKTKFKTRLIRTFSLFDHDDRLKVLASRWWNASDADALVKPDDEYLASLPEDLLLETKVYLFDDVFGIYRSYFEQNEFMLDMCLHFHPRQFQSGEMIMMEGDLVYEILFQINGLVAMGPMIDGELSPAIYFEKRCIVGDYSGLRTIPSFTSYKAVGNKPSLLYALAVPAFNKVLTEKYPELATELFAKSKQRFVVFTKLIKEHFAQMQQENPQKVLELNKKFWAPSVERILQLQKNEATKERDFVSAMQRNLLKAKLSEEVRRKLTEEWTKSPKWKQAMARACKAMASAYQRAAQ